MVDTKKNRNVDELHRAIWAIADELCEQSTVVGLQNYVLARCSIVIFLKICNYINSGEIDAGK